MIGALHLTTAVQTSLLATASSVLETAFNQVRQLDRLIIPLQFDLEATRLAAQQLQTTLAPLDVATSELNEIDRYLNHTENSHEHRNELHSQVIQVKTLIQQAAWQAKHGHKSVPLLLAETAYHLAAPRVEKSLALLRRDLGSNFRQLVDRFRNATPTQVLNAEQAILRWQNISVGLGQSWVDLGSGNGDSLGRIGRSHPEGKVIGIDLQDSTELSHELAHGRSHIDQLPDNVTYTVITRNYPEDDRLEYFPIRGQYPDAEHNPDLYQRATLDALGEGTHDVVSSIYPDPGSLKHLTKRRLRGAPQNRYEYQYQTLLRLLKPGGQGIIFLAPLNVEQQDALRYTIKLLSSYQEIEVIAYCPNPVPMEGFGLAEFGQRKDPSRHFTTAYPVFIRRKPAT